MFSSFKRVFATVLCGVAFVLAQAPMQGPLAPPAPPSYELDKKGKPAHIDFNLDVKPISDANMKFSNFANRKLMIFYFSAKCPHCQHAFPYIQKLADELAPKGVTSIAIAVQMNSEDDIRGFIRDFKCRLPVLWDNSRTLGENYGTGAIPLTLLINAKGEYIRYKSFEANETPDWIKKEVNLMK
jgi:thiol-disulfide isomerase/thioredoxin